MRVLIERQFGMWALNVYRNGYLIKTLTYKRLIMAIDAASTLQLHIDNIETLPLTQYLNWESK